MKNIADRIILITGGRQGIGRGMVDRFLAEGARVMTCGRGSRPDGMPRSVSWFTADVSSADDVRQLRDAVLEAGGAPDVLINNAGVQIEKTVVETTDEDWDTLIGANARGVFMMCRAFIPLMKPGSSIINIGSVSGNSADPGLALYNASKAFVHGLTRSIAVDHGPDIRCNAISPGWIDTGMADAAFTQAKNASAARADALARHPVNRFGQPADIAALAVWLASDESGFMTGQSLILDGGMTAASPINPGLF